jgi:myo-inositol-1-phosphate synthase
MRQKVRVAIIGVGNCASSLVQGVEFYRAVPEDVRIPGLMHANLGGYSVGDIEFSAAFDISSVKVGRTLAEAISAEPNNTIRFAQVTPNGVTVERGPTLDGLGKYLTGIVKESDAEPVDVTHVLQKTRTDVVVCYLPVGSQKAAEWYAEQSLTAGCAFVNCIPTFIASDESWRERFHAANIPLIGDDIKSQVGATIVHRVLSNLMRERGVRLDRTYQLNIGGNADFQNMLERERLDSKKISKTQAVTSQFNGELSPENVHIGPSDYVSWLNDRKFAYIRLEGTGFGNVPFSCEVKLEVWDSPNCAGVVIDAIRCAKIAMDRRIGGALIGPSSYFMKSPPQQFPEYEAQKLVEKFIADVQSQRPTPARSKSVAGTANSKES